MSFLTRISYRRQTAKDQHQIGMLLFSESFQPFLVCITGDPNSGKSILSTLISKELIDFFEASILYVVDSDHINQVIQYFSDIKMNSDKMTIKVCNNLSDIESAIIKSNFEFLFIDSNDTFKLNLNNIKALQRKNPKLSILCTMSNENSTIAKNCNILFSAIRTDNVAYASIYVDGVLQDQDCGIFIYNFEGKFITGL